MGINNRGLMAIRFAYHGCSNRPFYHIVVMPKHKGRNSRPIEQLGTYDLMPNVHGEKLVALNFDRIKHYIARGVQPSRSVAKLLGLCGFYPIHPMTYMSAKRNRQRLAAAAAELAAQEETPSEHTEQSDSQAPQPQHNS